MSSCAICALTAASRKREGAKHSLYMNPINGVVETVPRHVEIDNRLASKICNRLGIPEP